MLSKHLMRKIASPTSLGTMHSMLKSQPTGCYLATLSYSTTGLKEKHNLAPETESESKPAATTKSSGESGERQQQIGGLDYFKAISQDPNIKSVADLDVEHKPVLKYGRLDKDNKWQDPKAYAEKFIYFQKKVNERALKSQEEALKSGNRRSETAAAKPKVYQPDERMAKAFEVDKNNQSIDTASSYENENLIAPDDLIKSTPRDWRQESRGSGGETKDKFNKYREKEAEARPENRFTRKLQSEKYLQFKQDQENYNKKRTARQQEKAAATKTSLASFADEPHNRDKPGELFSAEFVALDKSRI